MTSQSRSRVARHRPRHGPFRADAFGFVACGMTTLMRGRAGRAGANPGASRWQAEPAGLGARKAIWVAMSVPRALVNVPSTKSCSSPALPSPRCKAGKRAVNSPVSGPRRAVPRGCSAWPACILACSDASYRIAERAQSQTALARLRPHGSTCFGPRHLLASRHGRQGAGRCYERGCVGGLLVRRPPLYVNTRHAHRPLRPPRHRPRWPAKDRTRPTVVDWGCGDAYGAVALARACGELLLYDASGPCRNGLQRGCP